MIDPNDAVDFILKNAKKIAQAKSDRIFLVEFRKSKKAILMGQSPAKSAVAREQYAYSHEEYLELIDGLRVAVEVEELLHWQMVAAQARIEIWRTQSANDRGQDRAMR
jgi:hypothetical protein